jgi:biotin-dependent carboxylase-like uncharacterized protein
VTLGGLELRALGPLTVAVTGAACPLTVDGRPVARNAVLELLPDQRLRLDYATAGLRCYLAARGGLDVPPVLGSRATDTLSGLGPARPQPGDRLWFGVAPPRWPVLDVAPVPDPPAAAVPLRVVPGPRLFHVGPDPGPANRLLAIRWQVGTDSDRVGLRLHPANPGHRQQPAWPSLVGAGSGSLPSEGLVAGSVQVPPAGAPVLFLADHPVTGGYPVIAVVVDADLDRAGQLRPGQLLSFEPVPAAAF